jgi:hypothetical protein
MAAEVLEVLVAVREWLLLISAGDRTVQARTQAPVVVPEAEVRSGHHFGDGQEDPARAAASGQPPALGKRRMMNALSITAMRTTLSSAHQRSQPRPPPGPRAHSGPAVPRRSQRHRPNGNRSSSIDNGNNRDRSFAKSDDAARHQQVSGQRLHIQQLPLPAIKTLHTTRLNHCSTQSIGRTLTSRMIQQTLVQGGL